jgi:NAD-dependent DNA ligase
VDLIAGLDGWSTVSAAGFVEHLPEFEAFLDTIGVTPRIKTPPVSATAAAAGPLKDAVILFTGFHPKDLEDAVPKLGGTVAEAWSKKVTLLVIKDASVSNEKTKKAVAAGIPVMTEDAFRAKIGL